jgi:hypothetical protein
MRSEQAVVWIDGLRRHLQDLQQDAYEGASGHGRDARYVDAFELLSPVATEVLQEVNASLLRGSGDVSVQAPGPDGHGGMIGAWQLSWPQLAEATNRFTGAPLEPVTIGAIFPAGFTHPHLVGGGPVSPRAATITAWPMQIASRDDAEQYRPVAWAIATAEVHDRIYQSSWRVIP